MIHKKENEIGKEYRPVPFWSWNDKLDVEETRRQVGLMDAAGMGGFFIHARGGLSTPYLGTEWFRNVEAAVEEAEKRGMEVWAYDENGWPSGFGNGAVTGMGMPFWQKYLRFLYRRASDFQKRNTMELCVSGGI